MTVPVTPAIPTPISIGPATLYHGDAYTIRPTLGWFDAEITDPPYAFKASGGGAYRARRPMMARILDEGLHLGFDLGILNPLTCGAAIVFAHNDQLAKLLAHLAGGFHRHALLVWGKTNAQPVANRHYRPDLEFYVHAWQRDYHPQGSMADKMRLTVTTSPRGAARFDHPTTKPDALMAKIVANTAGATVIDSFMGTGSTGVAAIAAGRSFTGIERDPRYFATAVQRITAAVRAFERRAA